MMAWHKQSKRHSLVQLKDSRFKGKLEIPFSSSALVKQSDVERILLRTIDKTPFNSSDFDYNFHSKGAGHVGYIEVDAEPRKLVALQKQIGGRFQKKGF